MRAMSRGSFVMRTYPSTAVARFCGTYALRFALPLGIFDSRCFPQSPTETDRALTVVGKHHEQKSESSKSQNWGQMFGQQPVPLNLQW